MTREPPLPLDWDCAACAALQAEIGRLMARIDEHHRIFEPMRAEIERLTTDRAKLIALLAEARGPQGEREERVAEWLRDRGYTVEPRAALEPKP